MSLASQWPSSDRLGCGQVKKLVQVYDRARSFTPFMCLSPDTMPHPLQSHLCPRISNLPFSESSRFHSDYSPFSTSSLRLSLCWWERYLQKYLFFFMPGMFLLWYLHGLLPQFITSLLNIREAFPWLFCKTEVPPFLRALHPLFTGM